MNFHITGVLEGEPEISILKTLLGVRIKRDRLLYRYAAEDVSQTSCYALVQSSCTLVPKHGAPQRHCTRLLAPDQIF